MLSEGEIIGLDPSGLLHRLGGNRIINASNSGKIQLLQGTVESLHFDDDYFKVALAMDNMHIWTEPLKECIELKGFVILSKIGVFFHTTIW